MFRVASILVLVLLSVQVTAETNIYAGAWSYHPGENKNYEWNETHNLLAVEHKGWIAGYFRNSIRRHTGFAGKAFSMRYRDWDLGVIVGAMHGYTRCIGRQQPNDDKRLCPMIVPSASYTEHWVQPTVYVMGNALAVGLRFEL